MNNRSPSAGNLTQNGKLQVMVNDINVGKPINGAKVRITDTGSANVIYELTTDSSGKTESVDLAAPPLEYSLGEGSGQPYSEYNIIAEAEGFESTSIVAAQILPTRLALQDISMTPLRTAEAAAQVIDVEPHTLWGIFPPKIPEPSVKPLPESEGLVVLPAPVVPEFVIVHLGLPSDSSAPNVWMPFKDYIKNVASCEIYSTWPDQTLRANILAILSFTLNRVFTEWYRGKGYNFTITNSTAYDHAFSYGRNIFDNISAYVDELFTSFITKPDIFQPLLAQYCDGHRTTCPNAMSQWGSKDLGDQGYTYINILRSFYGYDIFIESASRVEGVPVSFPGEPLASGSVGEPVRVIQRQLNSISNNYPVIPKLRVDGVFGPATEGAVKAFQQIFDLPVTGIVDMATWYAISNIYVAVEGLAELR